MEYKLLFHLISLRLQDYGCPPLLSTPGRGSDLTLQMSVTPTRWFTVASSSPRMKMYYEPHASRSNLIVLTFAHVTKISLSKVASGEVTAEGVRFLHEDNDHLALVRKEVIVSAGYGGHSPHGIARR